MTYNMRWIYRFLDIVNRRQSEISPYPCILTHFQLFAQANGSIDRRDKEHSGGNKLRTVSICSATREAEHHHRGQGLILDRPY